MTFDSALAYPFMFVCQDVRQLLSILFTVPLSNLLLKYVSLRNIIIII